MTEEAPERPNPFRVQPAFGAARSRLLNLPIPSLHVQRRPQPREEMWDVDSLSAFQAQPASVGAALQLERAAQLGTRESVIQSVGSTWSQDLGGVFDESDTTTLPGLEGAGTPARVAGAENTTGRRKSLSILGLDVTMGMPGCVPLPIRQHGGYITDLQSRSESELAPAKRKTLYTEEKVGRSRSKEDLAAGRHAAHHIYALNGAQTRDLHGRRRPPQAGRRRQVKSALAVLSTLDPPLAEPALPWVETMHKNSLRAHRNHDTVQMNDGRSVSLLNAVLEKNPATQKPSENVYIHRPTRRERRGLDPNSASVPLSVDGLKHQDYILTTEGLVTQVGSGHSEFMPMPDWLQESAYYQASNGRFNLFLWGIFNKFHQTCRRQKFLRTRRTVASCCLFFRATFSDCLASVNAKCVHESSLPPSKLLQCRRHGKQDVAELSRSIADQRVVIHESFVEMMEQISRLIERVISEVKAGDMRQKAKDIEQAQKDELYRWRKHGKDAAKLPGAPGSKRYGPNNRLHPKPPKQNALHVPQPVVPDTKLLPRFIRLCDFIAEGCACELLKHHCMHFVSALQSGSCSKIENFRTNATFGPQDNCNAATNMAAAVAGVGVGQSPGLERYDEETMGTVYFGPAPAEFDTEIRTALGDFVSIFNGPRLLFYEAFQANMKAIISFHEMNLVQSVEEVLSPTVLADTLEAVHSVLTFSYVDAERRLQSVWGGAHEFYTFAQDKLRVLRHAESIVDVSHLPKTLRSCHQWRQNIAELSHKKGAHVSAGVIFVDLSKMQTELGTLIDEIFHEGEYALERMLISETSMWLEELSNLSHGLENIMQTVMRLREAAADGMIDDEEAEAIMAQMQRDDSMHDGTSSEGSIGFNASELEQTLRRMISDAWDTLARAKSKLETLETMLAWLHKPGYWLPDQMQPVVDDDVEWDDPFAPQETKEQAQARVAKEAEARKVQVMRDKALAAPQLMKDSIEAYEDLVNRAVALKRRL